MGEFPVVGRNHPESNKLATGVENKATEVTRILMTALSINVNQY